MYPPMYRPIHPSVYRPTLLWLRRTACPRACTVVCLWITSQVDHIVNRSREGKLTKVRISCMISCKHDPPPPPRGRLSPHLLPGRFCGRFVSQTASAYGIPEPRLRGVRSR